MPVFIEFNRQTDQQDVTDLQLIYADLPQQMLPPFQDTAELLRAGRSDDLVVARFNSRLLGAALLSKQEQIWSVSHLCVRALTRRRGVMRRLLTELERMAAEQGASVQINISAAPQWLPKWLALNCPAINQHNTNPLPERGCKGENQ